MCDAAKELKMLSEKLEKENLLKERYLLFSTLLLFVLYRID